MTGDEKRKTFQRGGGGRLFALSLKLLQHTHVYTLSPAPVHFLNLGFWRGRRSPFP